jgi:UDP-N-acetylmuramoyl-tripeptide--D-alanyl-D-alanine ligase
MILLLKCEQGCQIAIVERPIDVIAQLGGARYTFGFGSFRCLSSCTNPQLKVIALTGSSGKTTTKEMLGSILSR